MKITMRLSGLALAVVLLTAGGAQAAPAQVSYEATDLGDGEWQYAYAVSNLTLPEPIEEFTIWFGLGRFMQLVVTSEDLVGS